MRSRTVVVWPGWLGALVLFAVVYVPPFVAANDLVVRFGNAGIQVGALLAALPGLVLIGLVAPLTDHRRSSALVAVVPIWGWVRVVEIGYDLATLAPTDAVGEVNEVDQPA